jgi:hypothetical protein
MWTVGKEVNTKEEKERKGGTHQLGSDDPPFRQRTRRLIRRPTLLNVFHLSLALSSFLFLPLFSLFLLDPFPQVRPLEPPS